MPGLSRSIPPFRAIANATVPQSMGATRQFVTEVVSGALEPLLQRHPWLPSDVLANFADIYDTSGLFTLLRRTMDAFQPAACEFSECLKQLVDCGLLTGADVIRTLDLLTHDRQVRLDDIFHI